jgi:hypothetical protein
MQVHTLECELARGNQRPLRIGECPKCEGRGVKLDGDLFAIYIWFSDLKDTKDLLFAKVGNIVAKTEDDSYTCYCVYVHERNVKECREKYAKFLAN